MRWKEHLSMNETKKLKRTALILIGIISLVLTHHLYQMIRVMLHYARFDIRLFDNNFGFGFDYLALSTYIEMTIVTIVLVISITLLLFIRKSETPFSYKIVNKLKIIAILLIANEIALHFFTFLFFRNVEDVMYGFNGDIEGVLVPFVYYPRSGYLIAIGLVVYVVSLILHYGISLQTQVDETL